MRFLLCAASILLISTSLWAQREEINFDSFPDVTVSIAPFNRNLTGTTNTFLIKPLINRNENSVSFLRFGVGVLNTLPDEENTTPDDVLSGRSAVSFNLGLESF